MVRFIAQLIAYLIGGIPFGYLVARAKAGIDIRQHGSGNIGATNVGRVLGLRFFVLVFVLDFLKGALPVLIALWLQGRYGDPSQPEYPQYLYLPELVGFATILGHMFPVYLGLRGGKGVATSIGVILTLAPWSALLGLLAWLIATGVTRMVSVGSIAFAVTFATAHLLTDRDPFQHERLGLTLFVMVTALLVIIRHWQNIGRIINGTESQIRWPSRR